MYCFAHLLLIRFSLVYEFITAAQQLLDWLAVAKRELGNFCGPPFCQFYTVSEKRIRNIFSYNASKNCPTFIIFGTNIKREIR